MHLEFVHECYEIQTKNLIALSDGFEFNYSWGILVLLYFFLLFPDNIIGLWW
jgi:hypothetical protein